MKWVNFIHNKVNIKLEKNEITLSEAVNEYYKNYLPKDVKKEATRKRNEKMLYLFIISCLVSFSIYSLRPKK